MSIIDLNTVSVEEHTSMTRYLTDSLFRSSGGKHGPMVIHILCYDQLETLTPLFLSTMLLDAILDEVFNDPYIDRRSIKIDYKGRSQGRREYEINMKLLTGLISQILKVSSEDTMHFVFSGMRPLPLDDEQRIGLARFMIDMGQLMRTVRTTFPEKDNKMVKCIFSGNYLFGCMYHHLESEKEHRRGKPEEDIFRQMLMLQFDEHGDWRKRYYQRIRFQKPARS